ncbi:MAG: hypothetical protein KF773_25030 [Deltaproteobacteria bacterium]|nr:hypothetical protein [Deltaproteobacteria bacterium]
MPTSDPLGDTYTIESAPTHAPSSPQAPLAHSVSSLHRRHEPASQTGRLESQSEAPMHSTQAPLVGSQTSAAPKVVQSAESRQPEQAAVSNEHTGALASHPFVAHAGTTHW